MTKLIGTKLTIGNESGHHFKRSKQERPESFQPRAFFSSRSNPSKSNRNSAYVLDDFMDSTDQATVGHAHELKKYKNIGIEIMQSISKNHYESVDCTFDFLFSQLLNNHKQLTKCHNQKKYREHDFLNEEEEEYDHQMSIPQHMKSKERNEELAFVESGKVYIPVKETQICVPDDFDEFAKCKHSGAVVSLEHDKNYQIAAHDNSFLSSKFVPETKCKESNESRSRAGDIEANLKESFDEDKSVSSLDILPKRTVSDWVANRLIFKRFGIEVPAESGDTVSEQERSSVFVESIEIPKKPPLQLFKEIFDFSSKEVKKRFKFFNREIGTVVSNDDDLSPGIVPVGQKSTRVKASDLF